MISAVIAHMPNIDGADEALEKCRNSLKGVDEVIVVVNDKYGFGPSINIGLNYAKGDYLIVMNNDIELLAGSLDLLAHIDSVTVPLILPKPRDNMPRSIYCMPRWVFDKLGGYDEQFEVGYFEDDDFIVRLKQAEVPIELAEHVVVKHLNGGGLTMKQVGEQKYFNINKERFELKYH